MPTQHTQVAHGIWSSAQQDEASLSTDGAQVHAKQELPISEPSASKTRASMAVPISADQLALPASSLSSSPTITENLHFTPGFFLGPGHTWPRSILTDRCTLLLPSYHATLFGAWLSAPIFPANLLVPSHFLTHLKAPPAPLGSTCPTHRQAAQQHTRG